MPQNKIEEPKVIEKERTYIYPNEFKPGQVVTNTLIDITKVIILSYGSHRVYTKDGKDHFVSQGFIKYVSKQV